MGRLADVDLSGHGFDEPTLEDVMLSPAAAIAVTQLDLSHNTPECAGIPALARALPNCPSLRELKFDSVAVEPAAADYNAFLHLDASYQLAASLHAVTQLTSIDITGAAVVTANLDAALEALPGLRALSVGTPACVISQVPLLPGVTRLAVFGCEVSDPCEEDDLAAHRMRPLCERAAQRLPQFTGLRALTLNALDEFVDAAYLLLAALAQLEHLALHGFASDSSLGDSSAPTALPVSGAPAGGAAQQLQRGVRGIAHLAQLTHLAFGRGGPCGNGCTHELSHAVSAALAEAIAGLPALHTLHLSSADAEAAPTSLAYGWARAGALRRLHCCLPAETALVPAGVPLSAPQLCALTALDISVSCSYETPGPGLVHDPKVIGTQWLGDSLRTLTALHSLRVSCRAVGWELGDCLLGGVAQLTQLRRLSLVDMYFDPDRRESSWAVLRLRQLTRVHLGRCNCTFFHDELERFLGFLDGSSVTDLCLHSVDSENLPMELLAPGSSIGRWLRRCLRLLVVDPFDPRMLEHLLNAFVCPDDRKQEAQVPLRRLVLSPQEGAHVQQHYIAFNAKYAGRARVEVVQSDSVESDCWSEAAVESFLW